MRLPPTILCLLLLIFCTLASLVIIIVNVIWPMGIWELQKWREWESRMARPPVNEAFYITALSVLLLVLCMVFCFMLFVHYKRHSFELKASDYVGKPLVQAQAELKLSTREKYFSLFNYYMGATYMTPYAGAGNPLHLDDTPMYRAYCYYNGGGEAVCFLVDENSPDRESRPVIDCYTTRLCKRSVDMEAFIGENVCHVYEKLGQPATDGWWRDTDRFGVEQEGSHRVVTFLVKGELCLSNYVYRFVVNDEGMVVELKVERERFVEEV